MIELNSAAEQTSASSVNPANRADLENVSPDSAAAAPLSTVSLTERRSSPRSGTSNFFAVAPTTISGNRSLCRIGVFYDGNFFAYAQNYFYHNRCLGWLKFSNFHSLLEEYLRDIEPGFAQYRVVYGGWFQGLYHSSQASPDQLKKDRNLQHDLMHAGITPHFVPMSQGSGREKGVDVALTLAAMQIGLENQIDIAVLVTGDGDFVPLAQMLMKYGIRSLAAYFDYTDEKFNGKRSFINERLLNAVNYAVNVNVLETNDEWRESFDNLFRKPDFQSPEAAHSNGRQSVPAES